MASTIVVGTDGSPTASEAVRQAAELARVLGARLHIVNAYRPASVDATVGVLAATGPTLDPVGLDRDLREQAEHTLERALSVAGTDLDLQAHTRAGSAADVILRVAEEENADIIVVGNKGMAGARRFLLGSVPNRVAHQARCNVMIVRTA